MDKFNLRKLGKTSKIDDAYWKNSHRFRELLMKAIEDNNDLILRTLLKDPKVFKGRA